MTTEHLTPVTLEDGGRGPMLATPDPVASELKFFTSFNPSSIAPLFVDVLRYLFRTAAPDHVKYSEDPEQTRLDIRVRDDQEPDMPPGARPIILVDRGDYGVQPMGMDNSAADYAMSPSHQIAATMHMAMANGMANFRIITWNFGTAELLGRLVAHFLFCTRPYLCNSQGFQQLGGLQVSRPIRDKDDRTKWIIDMQMPYSLEMKWQAKNLGPVVREFLMTVDTQ